MKLLFIWENSSLCSVLHIGKLVFVVLSYISCLYVGQTGTSNLANG